MSLAIYFRDTFNKLCILTIFVYTFYSLSFIHSYGWENLKYSSTIGSTNYSERWAPPISLQSTLNHSDVRPFEIVIWASAMDELTMDQLTSMKRVVKNMNQNENELCSEQEVVMGASDVSQPFCHFSLSSATNTIRGADAVAFFMFERGYKRSNLPRSSDRTPDQLWVMYGVEPPHKSIWSDSYRNIFNWTMTYRTDSNVITPYAKKVALEASQSDTIKIGNFTLNEWIGRKTKLVVGVITNCFTESCRDKLISQMNYTGKIDIYGKCGRELCREDSEYCNEDNFWDELAQNYKFYLAFENSLCKDYITEKFWRTLEVGMVPVVYGAGDYELEAPPNSYINVKDFDSVEKLMEYLEKLDKDVDEYAKYFEWRRSFRIQSDPVYHWCKLCNALRNYKLSSQSNIGESYENLQSWWQHPLSNRTPICETNPTRFLPWLSLN